MINPLEIWSGINLRVGSVCDADPIRNLYSVAPVGSLDNKVSAVPIDFFTLDSDGGVKGGHVYSVGDSVLYIESVNDFSHLPYAVILCPIYQSIPDFTKSKVLTFSDIEKEEEDSTRLLRYNALTGTLPEYSGKELSVYDDTGIAEILGIDKKEGFPVYNFKEYFPGDFVKAGKDTLLLLDDIAININAGKSRLLLDSGLDSITQSSIFYNRYTAAENKKIQLIDNIFYDSKELSLYPTHSLRKNKKGSHYTIIEQNSLYSNGKASSILNEDNNVLSTISQRLDGSIEFKAVGGVSLEKTVNIRIHKPKYNDSILVTDDINTVNKAEDYDTLLAILDNNDIWESSKLIDGSEIDIELLDLPGGGEGFTIGDEEEVLTDFNTTDTTITRSFSRINQLPSGGILLRDAWGSEIRMEGGNIQISAANNLINIAGRDYLDIANGVASINASGVQLGAKEYPVAIYSEQELKLKATKIAITGDELLTSMNNSIDIVTKDYQNKTDGMFYIRNTGKLLSIAANNTQVYGKGSVYFGTNYMQVAVDSEMTVGGNISMTGGITIANKPTTFSNILDNDGKARDIKNTNIYGIIQINGDIRATGDIATNGSVYVVGSVFANELAQKGSDTVSACTKGPSKFSIKNSVSSKNSVSVDVKKLLERVKDKVLEAARNIFSISSTAFTLFEPLFSVLKGRDSCKITEDKETNKLIYPGDKFWNSAGMLTRTDKYTEIDIGNNKTYSITGAVGLRFNSNNIKED